MKLVTAARVKELFGVSRVTMYRWRKLGIVTEYKTPTGKIRYDEQELLKLAKKINEEKVIIYSRVSSSRQKEDAVRQLQRLKSWCSNNGLIPNHEFIEIASGLNSSRRIFNKVLDLVKTGQITKLVVEHKDRLTRFGFEFIERYCNDHGCQIVIIEPNEVREDLVKDLIDIIVCFSSKLYGKRTSRSKAKRIAEEEIKSYD